MRPHLSAILTLSICLVASGCASPAAGPLHAMHAPRGATDWAGVYRGVLPCADCRGIETTVTLKPDGAYSSETRYLGKPGQTSSRQGTVQWDSTGSVITLSGDEPARFGVENDRLVRLALDGSRMTGALAERYVLTKATDIITDKYWKLVELRGQPVGQVEAEPHLILQADGKRVTGFSGCNSFTGEYTLDAAKSRISFEKVAMTRRFCSSGMDVERQFSEVLTKTDNYSRTGDSLSLNRGRMAPLARFEAVDLQ